MVTIIKELSNSSYNGTEQTLSNIILLLFIIFIINISYSLYKKVNPYANMDLNIFNAILQNTMYVIKNLTYKWSIEKMDETIQEEKDKINEMTKKLSEKEKDKNLIASYLINANKELYDSFTDKLNKYNNFIKSLVNIKDKISTMTDKISDNYKGIITTYNEKLVIYKDNLVKFLNNIISKVGPLLTIEGADNLIAPLKVAFVAVKQTLLNNAEFIKKIDNNFDASKLPNFPDTSAILTTSNINVSKSTSILSNYGYTVT